MSTRWRRTCTLRQHQHFLGSLLQQRLDRADAVGIGRNDCGARDRASSSVTRVETRVRCGGELDQQRVQDSIPSPAQEWRVRRETRERRSAAHELRAQPITTACPASPKARCRAGVRVTSRSASLSLSARATAPLGGAGAQANAQRSSAPVKATSSTVPRRKIVAHERTALRGKLNFLSRMTATTSCSRRPAARPQRANRRPSRQSARRLWVWRRAAGSQLLEGCDEARRGPRIQLVRPPTSKSRPRFITPMHRRARTLPPDCALRGPS